MTAFKLIDPAVVYGYENHKCLEIIASLIVAIESGIELPMVSLVEISDSEYHLPYKTSLQYLDGGHHRLIAHYLLERKITCNIITADKIPDHRKIKIPKINVASDEGTFQKHTTGKLYIQPDYFQIYRAIQLYNSAIDRNSKTEKAGIFFQKSAVQRYNNALDSHS